MGRGKKSHKIEKEEFINDGIRYVLVMFKSASAPLLTHVSLVKKEYEPDVGGLQNVIQKDVYEKSFRNQEHAYAAFDEILRRGLGKAAEKRIGKRK